MTIDDKGYSGHAVTGSRYNERRWWSAKDIAAEVRKSIKEAVAAGAMPGKADGFVYRVRSESFAGGQAVRINIVGPGEEQWAKFGHDQWAEGRPFEVPEPRTGSAREPIFNASTLALGKAVKAMGTQFTRDDSDSMIDYFDVSCYISVYAGPHGWCLA